jgi:biotin transport system substrate-specific component
MQAHSQLSPSLVATFSDLIATRSRAGRIAVGIGLAVAFAGLTVVGANIVIPIQPVPITLQTLFVLLAGASIGRGWGTFSQALYVGLGAAGLPVFAGGASGAGLLAGPTGGYLIAFLIAPFVVSALLRVSTRLAWQVAAFTLATLLILALGVAHLTLFYTHNIGQALTVGALPFLPGAVFKIVAAVSIYRSTQALISHYRARRTGD